TNPLSPGDPYKDSLRNFCPVIGSDNAEYSARDCALKLDLNAANYATYRSTPRKMPGGQVHPFVDKLLAQQGVAGGNPELNERAVLVNGSPTHRCYGKERIEFVADILIQRI